MRIEFSDTIVAWNSVSIPTTLYLGKTIDEKYYSV